MDVVPIERSLFIKQLLLAGPVLALGCFAYASLWDVATIGDAASGTPRDVPGALLEATVASAELRVMLAALVAVALTAGLCLLINRWTVVRPLRAVTGLASRLASGDTEAAITGEEREDEFGQLARSLRALQEAANRPTAPVAPAVAAAPLETRAPLVGERFSADLATQIRRLGAVTKRLSEAAERMTTATHHANDGSDQATAASANAAGDVSSVATASEQLLDSIEEISRQVVQSTNVVRAAVERAVETNAGMGRLSHAAQKVGDVVSLISRIAAQTNLLALNATIEAARAGEAGRGFAVVAQEVKTLATQTAKATQDITGQIADMQEATDLSVEAIDKIQTKIAEVEHISTIIASAVHEQGAATQEIARNVRSAAAGTTAMSSHMENVVRSVGETATSASSVATLARELDEIAMGMTEMVSSFGQNLRAA